MLRFTIDVMSALKDHGFTQYRLRNEKLLGQQTIRNIREGKPVSWDVIGKLCDMLCCDVGDILTVQPPEGDADHTSEAGET